MLFYTAKGLCRYKEGEGFETILNCLVGSSEIVRTFIGEARKQKTQRFKRHTLLALKMRKGTETKECIWPPNSGRGKNDRFSPRASRKKRVQLTP